MADATRLDIESKVEDAVIELIADDLHDAYTPASRWDGDRTEEGDVRVKATCGGQVMHGGKGAH